MTTSTSTGGSVVAVHRVDPTNLGDLWSAPYRHVPWLADGRTRVLDVFDAGPADWRACRDTELVVVGGGGMTGYCDEQVTALLDALDAPGGRERPVVVWWGAGSGSAEEPPAYWERFDLVGVRDWPPPAGARWVPCASCLSPELERLRAVEPLHDLVVYQALNKPVVGVQGAEDVPRLVNDGTKVGWREALEFLASGRRVLTRSFHGAYWAMLMGRQPVIQGRAALKFFSLPHPPTLMTPGRPVPPDTGVRPPQGLLERCREANTAFGSQVAELLRARS